MNLIFSEIVNFKLIYKFVLLNMNILLNIYTTVMKCYRGAFNIAFEGSVSQNSDLGFSF